MRSNGEDSFVVRAITGHKTMRAFGAYQAIEESDLTNAIKKLQNCSFSAAFESPKNQK